MPLISSSLKLRARRTSTGLWHTIEAVSQKHTLQMAAALSYYFVIAIFPAFVLLSAIVAYLPVHNFLDQLMSLMSGFAPPETRELVRKVLSDVVIPNRGAFLSFGLLGTLWTASG